MRDPPFGAPYTSEPQTFSRGKGMGRKTHRTTVPSAQARVHELPSRLNVRQSPVAARLKRVGLVVGPA